MPKAKRIIKRVISVKRKAKNILKRVATTTDNVLVTPTPKKVKKSNNEKERKHDEVVLNTTTETTTPSLWSSTNSISITPEQIKSVYCKDTKWIYKLPSYCHEKSINSSSSSSRKKSWNIDDFTLDSPIGRGKFGCVYHATEKKSCSSHQSSKSQQYALKILQKDKILNCDVAPKLLKREIEIHSRLRHSNIIKLYGYFHNNHKVFLVMEKAYGDLYNGVLSRQQGHKLNENVAANYIYQIANALYCMHDQQVYHRDLKPENILCSEIPSSSSNGQTTLKLCDFGWSVYAPEKVMRDTLCGTPEYVAPEMLRKTSQYDVRFIDSWSLGVLAIEMLVGNTPFQIHFTSNKDNKEIQNETFKKVTAFRKVSIKYKETISLNFYDFVNRTMTKDLKSRMSMREVLQHPWIISNGDNSSGIAKIGSSLSF